MRAFFLGQFFVTSGLRCVIASKLFAFQSIPAFYKVANILLSIWKVDWRSLNQVSLHKFLFAADIADTLSNDMHEEGLCGRTLTLKLKTASFEVTIRSLRPSIPSVIYLYGLHSIRYSWLWNFMIYYYHCWYNFSCKVQLMNIVMIHLIHYCVNIKFVSLLCFSYKVFLQSFNNI